MDADTKTSFLTQRDRINKRNTRSTSELQGTVYTGESTRVLTEGNMGFKRMVYHFLRWLAFHLMHNFYSHYKDEGEDDKRERERKEEKK